LTGKNTPPPRKIILADRENTLQPRKIILADREKHSPTLKNNTGLQEKTLSNLEK
jgi:hypothetical protein